MTRAELRETACKSCRAKEKEKNKTSSNGQTYRQKDRLMDRQNTFLVELADRWDVTMSIYFQLYENDIFYAIK